MKDNTMIYFSNNQEKYTITYSLQLLLRHAVIATLNYEGFENQAELSITFTDNEGIKHLNSEFRGIDAPTDVLSFPLTDYNETALPIDDPELCLGDIVISLERAKEQAKEFGHSFEREAAFLCVHSMLHLLGYDHEEGEAQDADMRKRQREILASMGLNVK